MSVLMLFSGGVIRDGRVTAKMEKYDSTTDSWTEVRNLPEPRMCHAMCVSKGKIYVSGGLGQTKTTKNGTWFW